MISRLAEEHVPAVATSAAGMAWAVEGACGDGARATVGRGGGGAGGGRRLAALSEEEAPEEAPPVRLAEAEGAPGRGVPRLWAARAMPAVLRARRGRKVVSVVSREESGFP